MKYFISKYALPLALVWTTVIFILCWTPGKYVPTAHWLDLLSFDKFVHACIFFVLSCLWFSVLIKKRKAGLGHIALVLGASIGYGGLLEIMQATVFSQRSGDWNDFVANSTGCLLALCLFKGKKWL